MTAFRLCRTLALAASLVVLVLGCTPPTKSPDVSFEPKAKWGQSKKPLDDLKDLAQDTSAYLDKSKSEIPLLSPETAKWRFEIYIERLMAPWRGSNPNYARRTAQRALAVYAKKPGFDEQGRQRFKSWVDHLSWNANLRAPNTCRPAIAIANTNLRAMPTMEGRYGTPGKPGQGYPFDMLQVSALWIGMPVFVDHVSRDGAWALVETAIAPGWVRTADLAYVDEAFTSSYLRHAFAGFTQDNVALDVGQGRDVRAGVGAVLPVEDTDGVRLKLLVPAPGAGGLATTVPVWLRGDQAALMPMAATPSNVARIANQMMGQPYGWGGLDGKRDCSALTRDVLAPFGMWLPRNSSAQAKVGAFVSLAGLSPEEKEQAILRQGVPFGSLIWMSGHIMLYVGQFEGRPLVFHNMWGLRTLEKDGSEGRKVVGKAVVTSLRIGEIYPDVGPERMLLMRVRGMANVSSGQVPAAETEPGQEGESAGQVSGE